MSVCNYDFILAALADRFVADPGQIMKEIKRLERQRDVERNIEQKAARMADLYKQSKSDSQRTARKEATVTESNIEMIDNLLRQQRELMRLYEPSVGLVLTTSKKQTFTFVLRTQTARDEWVREIDTLRRAELACLQGTDSASADKAAKGFSIGAIFDIGTLSKKISRTSAAVFGSLLRMGGVETTAERRRKLKGSSSAGSFVHVTGNGTKTATPMPAPPGQSGSGGLASSSSAISSSGSSSLRQADLMEALEEMDPLTNPIASHTFESRNFKRPTRCDICDEFIWGLGREGIKCVECSTRIHRRCLNNVSTFCSLTRDAVIDRMDEADDSAENHKQEPDEATVAA